MPFQSFLKRYGTTLLGVTAILLGLIFACGILIIYLGWGFSGYIDFALHKHEYQQIVADIKAMHSTTTTSISTEYATIRGRKVSFEKDPSGNYAISIVIYDWNHAGCGGYLYSDGPFQFTLGDPYSNIRALGDLWTSNKQVADHWRVIECNLH